MNARHRFERLTARGFSTAAIVGTIFIATSGIAAAAGLFDTATQAEMRLAAQIQAQQEGARDRLVVRPSPIVRRDRVVRVNAAELARIIPTGADEAVDRLERTRNLARSVTIELFAGTSVTVQRTDIETPEEGGYVWLGEENRGEPSYVSLAIHNGEIVGRVLTGRKIYTIRPISGAVHRIVEIDAAKIPEGYHPPRTEEQQIEDMKPANDPPLSEADGKAVTIIKVLVAHTVNARNEIGFGSPAQLRQRMNQEINAAIARSNNVFKNSKINIRYLRVGGTNEVDYADTTLYGGTGLANYLGSLCDLTGINCSKIGSANNQKVKFADVRNNRNKFKADLVVLFRKEGSACGIAWVPNLNGTVLSKHQNLGFSVASSTPSMGCLASDTFAHETGHNMGLNHDRTQHRIDTKAQGPAPPSQFNFGHVVNQFPGSFITIMSYPGSCPGCGIIPFHSNPNVTFVGVPTGVKAPAAGFNGAADAAKRLTINKQTIAGFR